MKKLLFIFCFVTAFILFGVTESFACSCLAPDPNKSVADHIKEAFGNSSAVFSAAILKVVENQETNSTTVKLKLVKSWKGKLTKILNLTTASNSAMCGYEFVKGKTYLIYAYGKGKKLGTNICTRTALVAGNKDVAVLDGLKK